MPQKYIAAKRGRRVRPAAPAEARQAAFGIGCAGAQRGCNGDRDSGEPAGGDAHGRAEQGEGPEVEPMPGRAGTHV